MFPVGKQPNFTRDVAGIQNKHVKEIAIDHDTKNIKLLSSLPNIDTVWIYWVNQKEFDSIISLINPRHLYVYGVQIPDLSSLECLADVETICLQWNTKASTLWDVSQNTRLRKLGVEDFKHLVDISVLSDCFWLDELTLAGGVVSNTLKLDNLSPLSALVNLKTLGLNNIRVKDESLSPLQHLKTLKELHISNQFPTEEYAKLSVHLRKTTCDLFQPYKKLLQHINGKDVMVTGKRKPFLNSVADVSKLEKYASQFKQFQDKERKELAEL
ncbi:internalin [Priestia megaterium]|nr:internalin [Priestia megaterium]